LANSRGPGLFPAPKRFDRDDHSFNGSAQICQLSRHALHNNDGSPPISEPIAKPLVWGPSLTTVDTIWVDALVSMKACGWLEYDK